MVIAPYPDERGIAPRAYLVREDGYPVAKVDGPRGFRTWRRRQRRAGSRSTQAPWSASCGNELYRGRVLWARRETVRRRGTNVDGHRKARENCDRQSAGRPVAQAGEAEVDRVAPTALRGEGPESRHPGPSGGRTLWQCEAAAPFVAQHRDLIQPPAF